MTKLVEMPITVELFGEQLPLRLTLGYLAQASIETGRMIMEDPKFFCDYDETGKPSVEPRAGDTFRRIQLLHAALLHLDRGITLQQVLHAVSLTEFQKVQEVIEKVLRRDLVPVGTPSGAEDGSEDEAEDPFVETIGSVSGPSDATISA